MLDPTPARRAQLRAIGRLGGLTTSATTDMVALGASGADKLRNSFENGHACSVCPPITIPRDLPAKERERRANQLYRLHFTRLARRRRR